MEFQPVMKLVTKTGAASRKYRVKGKPYGSGTSLKQLVGQVGRWFLAKFLGISPNAFTEDLVAVARKKYA